LGATYTDRNISAAFNWEIDLWGRLREGARAGRADARAGQADLASARLSLHAMIADTYFQLRGLDAEADLLRQTVAAYARAEDLTNTRHEGGIASGLDANRARSQLSDAKARLSEIALDRATSEHALAVLVGQIPSTFSIAPANPDLTPPATPIDTPAALLQRRPDIAAAERRMAAANSRIGVARAAWFPSLTLGASGGYDTTVGSLITAPASFWALGPLTSAATIFDGGRRSADVRRARAEFDEAAADYRQTVLTAFRDVEDSLASTRYLASAEHDQNDAAAAADRTADLALTRYRDGASDYLEVVVAQTAALTARRSAINLRTQRLQAGVSIIRALGGGFDASSLQSASLKTIPQPTPAG
jgi:multidrug efflux system outer membrane protein